MYILETSKEDLDLAREEIKSISNSEIYQEKNLFEAECEFTRLTYLNRAFETIDEIPKCDTFKIVEVNIKKKDIFDLVEDVKNKGSKVDLEKPQKIFTKIKFKEKIYLCEQIYKNKKEFRLRNPKSRPGFHPGACKPDFAKVMINLSGVKRGNTILDPFCGTGGILIEAGFMNIKAKGSDIDQKMLSLTKLNLEHYKLKADLEKKNALEINSKVDAIVTEIPFGTTTKIIAENIQDLINKFIQNIITKEITNTIVIGVPNKIKFDFRPFKIKFKHEVYIHKSLSKIIYILKLND